MHTGDNGEASSESEDHKAPEVRIGIIDGDVYGRAPYHGMLTEILRKGGPFGDTEQDGKPVVEMTLAGIMADVLIGDPEFQHAEIMRARFVERVERMSVEEITQLLQLMGKHARTLGRDEWKFNTMQADVWSFMMKMDQVVGDTPALRDTVLRKHLIDEEAREAIAAIEKGDLVEAVDGVLDLIYVCIGALCAWGVTMHPYWNEVHVSNMQKSGQNKDDRGKVLKPKGWFPPRIKELLIAEGWKAPDNE